MKLESLFIALCAIVLVTLGGVMYLNHLRTMSNIERLRMPPARLPVKVCVSTETGLLPVYSRWERAPVLHPYTICVKWEDQ